MLFDFDRLETLQRYKVLSFTVLPRPIAWIVTQGADGSRNAAPFSFFSVMTSDPPLVTIGFTERRPHGKDTPRCIEETGEFVVNLVPYGALEAMNVTAIEFDGEVDELAEAKLSIAPSTMVKPPRIAESPAALECSLYQMIKLESGQSITIGKVLAAHIADEAVIDADRCYIDTAKLDLIGRMNNCYVRPQQVIQLPRISVAEWRAQRAPATE